MPDLDEQPVLGPEHLLSGHGDRTAGRLALVGVVIDELGVPSTTQTLPGSAPALETNRRAVIACTPGRIGALIRVLH